LPLTQTQPASAVADRAEIPTAEDKRVLGGAGGDRPLGAPATCRLNPACEGSVARPAGAARSGLPDLSAVCVAISNPRKPRS